MERLPSKSSGLAAANLKYLLPATFEDDPLRRLHAARTVAFGLAMLFWAPIFALIYYLLGSPRGAMMIGWAAGAVVLALVSLRWTEKLEFDWEHHRRFDFLPHDELGGHFRRDPGSLRDVAAGSGHHCSCPVQLENRSILGFGKLLGMSRVTRPSSPGI